jgi:uncharacterized protein (TIGR02996 family)
MDHARELTFARMMLTDPSNAMHRLAYANWLEEYDDVERAALIREADGWDDNSREPLEPMWQFLYEGQIVFSIRLLPEPYSENSESELGVIARIYDWPERHFDSLDVRPDGTSHDDDRNWAWLLSLAMARGLKIPGLNVPVADPELET